LEMINLLQTLEIGITTGVISLTLAKSKLFSPMRNWIRYRSPWWGELVSCPYCASHWVGGLLVATQGPGSPARWLIVSAMAIAVGALTSAVLFKAISSIHPQQPEMSEEELYAEST
jgi:Protein of unknown function (DUF1360)